MRNMFKGILKISVLSIASFLFVLSAVHAASWTIQKSFMPGNGDVVTPSLKTTGTRYYGKITAVRHVLGIGQVNVSSTYQDFWGQWKSVSGSQNIEVSPVDYTFSVPFGVNKGTNVKLKWALTNDAYLLANLEATY